LAIDRFLGAGKLDELVGRRHLVSHAGGESVAIPLPHPSGASSWVNHPEHRVLLHRALEMLERELAALGVGREAEPMEVSRSGAGARSASGAGPGAGSDVGLERRSA
jgi:uracil-DNA glycosylase